MLKRFRLSLSHYQDMILGNHSTEAIFRGKPHSTLESFIGSIINFAPLIVFEVTLLLIPPAISWLYALLHVSSFTGSALIECHPKGVDKAEIFIDGMKTGLFAPNRITLKEGKYNISLKNDYWDSSDIDIAIEPGTENRYIINIVQNYPGPAHASHASRGARLPPPLYSPLSEDPPEA